MLSVSILQKYMLWSKLLIQKIFSLVQKNWPGVSLVKIDASWEDSYGYHRGRLCLNCRLEKKHGTKIDHRCEYDEKFRNDLVRINFAYNGLNRGDLFYLYKKHSLWKWYTDEQFEEIIQDYVFNWL